MGARPLAVLLLLAGGAVLAACGGPEGPRLEIVTSALDGPPPEGLRVRDLRQEDVTFPLVRLDDGGRTYVAEGAPDGAYSVEAPGGWGMLWPQTRPPELRRDAPQPLAVQLGRPHSLYVGSSTPGQVPGTSWAAVGYDEAGRSRSLLVQVERDEHGLAILRFAPKDWKGEIRVVGRTESGLVTSEVRFRPAPDGRPAIRGVQAADTAPLHVHRLGRPRDDEGLVRVKVAGLALEAVFERRVRDGVAFFEALPFLDRPLAVSAEGADGEFLLAPGEWHGAEEMRIYVPPEDARTVRLRVPKPSAVSQVQVLDAAAGSFGLASFEVAEGEGPGEIRLRVPRGTAVLLVRSDASWASLRMEPEEEERLLEDADFLPGGSVTVRLEGASGRVLLRRIQSDGEFLGQGFVRRVTPGASLDTTLPPGEYRVSAEIGSRTVSLPAPVRVAPGAKTTVPIDARR